MHRSNRIAIALAAALISAAGCYHDKPHEYGQLRPPVEDLDSRDSGLQSKDVVAASDQMAQDLLALPELNQSSHQWTIVVDRVENHTTDAAFDLNIFLERLRVNLSKYGHGRVTLIENKAQFHGIQDRELEGGGGGGGDQFGQGSGAAHGGPSAGIQPDYGLYAKITEMPNRGTSYFFCEFTLTNLHSRVQVWTKAYEVKVAR
jgi:Peptidoglycan-synthase activator LpoB